MSQYVNEVLEGLKKKAPWETLFIQAATTRSGVVKRGPAAIFSPKYCQA